jgi:hypothetical protein
LPWRVAYFLDNLPPHIVAKVRALFDAMIPPDDIKVFPDGESRQKPAPHMIKRAHIL